jgi:hypothetical protein
MPLAVPWLGVGLAVMDLQRPEVTVYFGQSLSETMTMESIILASYLGCSQTGLGQGPGPDQKFAKFCSFTGMASKLFSNKFFQVQFDGQDLCEWASSDPPFGYYCTVNTVQAP